MGKETNERGARAGRTRLRRYFLLSVGGVLLGATIMSESTAQRTQPATNSSIERLADEMEIRRVVDDLDNAVDAKD